MGCYLIGSDSIATEISMYQFNSEASAQVIIQQNPYILINELDIGFQNDRAIISCREFSTSRGFIDVLMITDTADIIIIETKLLINPESQRTVVAQVIDYAKALSRYNATEVLNLLSKNSSVNKEDLSKLSTDDFWLSSLGKNLRTGNFQVLVVGDIIHPNLLGMVESIQSAPHLSFTISLIELNAYSLDDKQVILQPRIISNSIEIERSVIRIEIDHDRKSHTIESELPEIESKGTKPKLNEEQYLNVLTKPDYIDPIMNFWSEWKDIGGDIKWHTASFSAGISYNGRRIPLFYGYRWGFPIITELTKDYYKIPDEAYKIYKDILKESSTIYDGFVVANRVDVKFESIIANDLETVMKASFKLAQYLINSQNND